VFKSWRDQIERGNKVIRVLIVDDSAVLRQQIRFILQSDRELEVISEARNGEEAVILARELHPDLITMDVEMPKMNGLDAIRQIMAQTPVPIVVVTSEDMAQELEKSSQALRLGALAVVRKPGGLADPGHKAMAARLLSQVKLMSGVKVVSRMRTKETTLPPNLVEPPAKAPARQPIEIIAIGASTGGPAALYRVLSGLPEELSVPIVVVQHIAVGFVEGLAGWLAGGCKLPVKVAKHGEKIQPGVISVAPDGCHMTADSYGRIRLRDSAPVNGHRPSVTTLFQSMAEAYGPRAMGVILTGMGADGALGMKAMKDAGALTLAQDEQSCVVFGMPKEAIALGAVRHVVPLDKMAQMMVELVALQHVV
jgi:two-component system, chemotaxis family, protein-glutamate methylesterase/glutaminase